MKKLLLCLSLLALAGCAAPAFLQPAYQMGQPTGMYSGVPQNNPGTYPGAAQGPPASQAPAQGSGLDLGQAYRSQTSMGENGKLNLGSPNSVPLRGWNGDVVQAPVGGTSLVDDGNARALEPEPSGRMYIIELYQELLDERDALRAEVDNLNESLLMAQGHIGESKSSAIAGEQRAVVLEEEVRRLMGENEDLSARLTTAQIRRLEAEKMLLEAQIRWSRNATNAVAEAEEKKQ